MNYKNTLKGTFIERPNRFIAYVDIEGNRETVHVKNTGRCKELLLPGSTVVLDKSDNPDRKTKYDLVSVWKDKLGWVNIDSQAPNKIAGEWLESQGYSVIKPEYKYGSSRIDFYMEKWVDGRLKRYLMEVKGCTLEIDGVGYFPDAPTERGIKHIKELIKAKKDGYEAMLAFVIQMNGIREVRANYETHPEFGEVLKEAKRSGVCVVMLPCEVTENQIAVQDVQDRGTTRQ